MSGKKVFAVNAAAAALLFFLVSVPGAKSPAPSGTDATHSPAKRFTLPGVFNSGEVSPTLFRGAQPTVLGLESLAKSGINIVVDLRFENDRTWEREAVARYGMQYVGIPWSCHFPSDAITARFLAVAHENPDKKIFVHCEHGVDRTGMMIAAYRMAEQGWTSEQARREMVAYGFDFTHRTWCRGLSLYEADFPHHFSTAPEFDFLRKLPANPR